MKYSSLDIVVKGYLLQRRYPIHWYIDCLVFAHRCFQEISFDSIGNVRAIKLRISEFGAVTLPDDYMEWSKVGIPAGQFIRPLSHRESMNRLNDYSIDRTIATLGTIVPGSAYVDGFYTSVPLTGNGSSATANITVAGGVVTAVTMVLGGEAYNTGDILTASNTYLGGSGSGFSVPVLTVTSSGQILYPSTLLTSSQSYLNRYNWYSGVDYGGYTDYGETFKVIPEKNEIQLQGNIGANDIILEYISDGSEIDNATQITPYSISTLESYINWKLKESGRSYSEGERNRAQRQFEQQHRILRARMNGLTMSDIKRIIFRNTLGSPK